MKKLKGFYNPFACAAFIRPCICAISIPSSAFRTFCGHHEKIYLPVSRYQTTACIHCPNEFFLITKDLVHVY